MNYRSIAASLALVTGVVSAGCGANSAKPKNVTEAKVGGGFLQITASITPENRATAASVYRRHLQPFLETIDGAHTKKLLIRDNDVQILHGFDTKKQAQAYLSSDLFTQDVLTELGPLLASEPEIRSYDKLPVAESGLGEAGAFLEITLEINNDDREAAAGVYLQYLNPFLGKISGAVSKELVIRDEDVQVLHGFSTASAAKAYLSSELFNQDVVVALTPYLQTSPDVRIYEVLTN